MSEIFGYTDGYFIPSHTVIVSIHRAIRAILNHPVLDTVMDNYGYKLFVEDFLGEDISDMTGDEIAYLLDADTVDRVDGAGFSTRDLERAFVDLRDIVQYHILDRLSEGVKDDFQSYGFRTSYWISEHDIVVETFTGVSAARTDPRVQRRIQGESEQG